MLLFIEMRDEKGPTKHDNARGHSEANGGDPLHAREAQRGRPPTAWRRFHWVGLCLSLLVAACSNTPAPPSVTPAASGPAQVATISAYHGHTSTIFAVAGRLMGRASLRVAMTARSRSGMRRVGSLSSLLLAVPLR
jgi:hypothetical protein